MAIAKVFNGTAWVELDAKNADTVDGKHASDFASASHTHDSRYYTESEIDSKLAEKANSSHSHSWSSVTSKPSTFAPSSHSHAWGDITGKPSAFTPSSHDHDSRYYTESEVDTKLSSLSVVAAPAGTVMAYAGSSVPSGWLECNGQAVSRSTYSALYSAIGTRYGAGNGSTTFNVPDYRVEFLRGWDHGRGVDSGRTIGSYQADALQNITGTFSTGRNGRAASGAFQNYKVGSWSNRNEAYDGDKWDFDASRVARTANETRPRNRAVMYIIKY